MQSKKQSIIESCTNILIGYCVAVASQIVVFPLVGVEASFSQNIKIGLYFTAISFARLYIIRRFFNRKSNKATT